MCGIAGYFGRPTWEEPPRQVLRRMVAAIRHRGPDASGVLVDGPVGLGHARLSIIDHSGGAQPMSDAEGAIRIAFNGEIFNYIELRDGLRRAGHAFRTASDTEVIIEAYRACGLQCLDEFNGDFAFALWDKRSGRLLLARDRMGVRPLYYTMQAGLLLFASEVKSLFQAPGVRAEIDPIALSQTLTFWHPIAPRTAFKGVHELPPGHYLVAEGDAVHVRPYWRPTYPTSEDSPFASRSEDDLAEELLSLLTDATRIRLRADVPVGAYLSGGLDSSAVAALVKSLGRTRMRTFSIGFDEAEFDETRFQQEAAQALGCEHQSITVGNAAIAAAFPEVVRHAERPLVRTAPAPMYLLANLVHDNGFKVVLTGEGADEIFGGYDLFKEAKVRRFWSRDPASSWRPALLQRLYPYLPGLQGQSGAVLRAFFKVGIDRPDDPFFSHRPRWASSPGLHRFLSDAVLESLKGYDPVEELRAMLPEDFTRWRPLAQAQYLETAHLLPGYILSSQGDRMAMAHAVEGRFPFLDHRVVEFASHLPPRLKLRGLTEKYLLRKCMTRHLPPIIAQRPKQPYRAPAQKCFFRVDAPSFVRDALSPASIARAGCFDGRAVETFVRKCQGGTLSARDDMALTALLSVQLLDEQFVRGPATPSTSFPLVEPSEVTVDAFGA